MITDFTMVYKRITTSSYPNEASFRQDFIEALKNELSFSCRRKASLINVILEYKINKRKRADTKICNIIFEFERPSPTKTGISTAKRQQLFSYLSDMHKKYPQTAFYGVITNGWYMEIYKETSQVPLYSGRFLDGAKYLVMLICINIQKFSIIEPDDFIAIYGV